MGINNSRWLISRFSPSELLYFFLSLDKSDCRRLTHYPKREFAELSPAQEASEQCLGFSDLKQQGSREINRSVRNENDNSYENRRMGAEEVMDQPADSGG